MKNLIKGIVLICMLFAGTTAKSQVLISLLFGEALNTPKIEFGLVGGINRSYMLDIEGSKGLNTFNIGFYFHIKLNEAQTSFLSTGVLVKSNTGARGMNTYPIGNQDLDTLYENGELTKKVGYFQVPIMYQYRLKQRWYFEGGLQVGLRNKAFDIFSEEAFDGDLSFTTRVNEQYKRLDAGLLGGVGFKFKRELKSAAVGINYYYGLVNVSKTDVEIKNSAIYFYAKIPIGASGKKKDN